MDFKFLFVFKVSVLIGLAWGLPAKQTRSLGWSQSSGVGNSQWSNSDPTVPRVPTHTQAYYPTPNYGVPFQTFQAQAQDQQQPSILDIRKHTHSHSEHTITKEIGIPIPRVVHVPKPYPVEKVVHIKVPVYVQVPSAGLGTASTWQKPLSTFVDHLRPPPQGAPGAWGYLPPTSTSNINFWQNGPTKIPLNLNLRPYQDYSFGQKYYGRYVPSYLDGLNGHQGYNTYASEWKW